MAHLPQEILSAYLDGELPAEQAADARRHLSTCASCSSEIAAFQSLDAALGAAPALSCEAARPLISAQFDGEADSPEALAAATHLVSCEPCRAARQAWVLAESTMRTLPAALPSHRVDAAMAALAGGHRRQPAQRRLSPGGAFGGAVAIGLAALMAAVGGMNGAFGPTRAPVGSSQAPAASTIPVVVQQPGGQVVVASAVQQVLNTRTSTLYVLQPDQNRVNAIDPFSKLTRAAITVPAKPITLAVNEDANKVYVVDVLRQLVEIDGATNTVTSTTPNVVQGTPTAVSYDAAKKQIVIAASVAASPSARPTASAATGEVAVLDSSSKTALQTQTVDAAPQAVVFDDDGARALLVTKDATTIVDARDYSLSLKLPGGVAGAFSTLGHVAVISGTTGQTRIAFYGSTVPPAMDLEGAPIAITPLPDGGFGVLTDVSGRGRVYALTSDGKVRQRVDVALTGRSLRYDAATNQLAVVGSDVGYATLPAASASPSTALSAASSSPRPSASASQTTAPKPAASPVAVAQPSASPAPLPVPPGAAVAWTGTYRIDLAHGRRAAVAAIDPTKTKIWFVDQARRVNAMSLATYEVFSIAQLPAGANVDELIVGAKHVYAIDRQGVQLYDVALPSELMTSRSLGLLRDAVGFTVTPDDRLWFARPGLGQLFSYDPTTGSMQLVNTSATSITAVTASGTKVWFAGADNVVGSYDLKKSRVTEYTLAHGNANAITVDARGSVWIGTQTGELLQVANGTLLLSARTGRAVLGFAVSGSGDVWTIASGAGATSYGPVDGSRTRQTLPGGVQTLFFDALGRAWLLDASAGVFYATEAAP